MSYTAYEISFHSDDFLTDEDQEWFQHVEAEQWALAQDAADHAESIRHNDRAEYQDLIAEAFELD
jgi:hypothetical protein